MGRLKSKSCEAWQSLLEASTAGILLCLGFWMLCLGTLGGNIFIAIGHGLLLVGIAFHLFGAERLEGRRTWVNRREISLSFWFLLSYIVVCLASILVKWPFYDSGFDVLKKLRYEAIILLLLMIPGCIDYLRKPFVRKVAIGLIALVALVVCITGIISYFTGVHPVTGKPLKFGRVGGVSGTVMSFAYSLQFFVLVIGALVVCGRDNRAWLERCIPWRQTCWPIIFSLFAAVLVAFFLSGSRGALGGVAVGGLVLVICLAKRWLWALSIGTGSILLLWFWKTQSNFLEYSDPVRAKVWTTSILTFLDHPMVGLGYRQLELQSHLLAQRYGVEPLIPNSDNPYAYFKGHAHNNVIEAFAGTGVFGGIMFCGFCVTWILECTRTRLLQIFILPGVVAFCVSGMFESTFIDSETVNVVMLLYLVSQMLLTPYSGDPANGELAGDG